MSHRTRPLPIQLRNFVRADNLAFQAELDAFNAQRASNSFDPMSSIHKRQASNDSDLEVEYDHSPPTRAEDESLSSASSPLDPNPINGYDDDEVELLAGSHKLPPGVKMRPLAPKPPSGAASNGAGEASLQEGQEMRETAADTSLLAGVKSEYKLGSYVPDIKMEDDEGYFEGEEEEEEEGRPRG